MRTDESSTEGSVFSSPKVPPKGKGRPHLCVKSSHTKMVHPQQQLQLTPDVRPASQAQATVDSQISTAIDKLHAEVQQESAQHYKSLLQEMRSLLGCAGASHRPSLRSADVSHMPMLEGSGAPGMPTQSLLPSSGQSAPLSVATQDMCYVQLTHPQEAVYYTAYLRCLA